MKNPPKRNISTNAVYDKVDGPIYYAKGGRIYKKGYADGGDVDLGKLTPDQLSQYNLLTDPAERSAFLDNAGGKLSTGLTNAQNAGIGAAAGAVGQIGSQLVDQDMSNHNITQKDVFSTGLKRAGQGAALGTSILPGIGTAVGAGLGALEGGIEGYFGGKKQEDANNVANKERATAVALAEKQRRAAAAKANMNPWEIGYGMAMGGKVKGYDDGGEIDSVKPNNKKTATFYGQRNTVDPKTNQPVFNYYKVQAPYGTQQEYNNLSREALTSPGGFQGSTIPVDESEFLENYKIAPQSILYGKWAGSYPTTKETPFHTKDDLINLMKQKSAPIETTPIVSKANGGKVPSPEKALEMLHNPPHGVPLTDKQRKYFGYLSNKLAKGGTVNFQNEEKYRKWIAYGHIHHKFTGKEKVSIAGKPHKVNHKSDGGEIEGAGTAKSDSIKAKVKAGSFIVPEENSKLAEEIREKYFGKNKEAKLEQKEGEHVMLSNGEHMFTTEEVKHLEEQGIDLNELAPNQENGKHGKQDGGDVDELEQLADGGDVNDDGALTDEEKRVAIQKAKTEKYNYLNAYADAPKSKKSVVNKGGIANVGKKNNPLTSPIDYMQPQSVAAPTNHVTPTINETVTPPIIKDLTAKTNNGTATPDEKSKLADYLSKAGKFVGDNAGVIPGVAGLALSGWQAGKGIKQLNSLGARPVDQISPEFNAAVDQAKNDAKYGISPEERNITERGIQGAREADVANIVNQAGGSGGTALANIRAAGNQAQNNLGNLSAESERLRFEKQRYANNLIGQKAAMQRQLFGDKMNAFEQNQQAGAGLLGAGIQNAFGALRYTGEALNQNKLAKTGTGAPYTGATKSSKRDYMSAAGGDETKARALANQYGENYDSLNNF